MRSSHLNVGRSTTLPLSIEFCHTSSMLFQNFITITIVLAGVLLVPIHAHPGEMEPILTSRELDHRQADINARHAVVRNCAGAITAFEAQRRARRSALIAKRHGNPHHHTASSTAQEPTYTALQNVGLLYHHPIGSYSHVICQTTCVLTPEGVEGPFYIVRILNLIKEPVHFISWLMENICSMKSYSVQMSGTEWTVSPFSSTSV